MATPPPPPRVTDAKVGFAALVQWCWDFYRSVVVEDLYVTKASQTETEDFDPSSLPDPATSTIATAQKTANDAYTLAAQADSKANAAKAISGQVAISETSSSGEFAFTDEQKDTSYYVTCTPTAFTGTPSIDATKVISITKTTAKFTVTTYAAPGAGNSVTFDFQVTR